MGNSTEVMWRGNPGMTTNTNAYTSEGWGGPDVATPTVTPVAAPAPVDNGVRYLPDGSIANAFEGESGGKWGAGWNGVKQGNRSFTNPEGVSSANGGSTNNGGGRKSLSAGGGGAAGSAPGGSSKPGVTKVGATNAGAAGNTQNYQSGRKKGVVNQNPSNSLLGSGSGGGNTMLGA